MQQIRVIKKQLIMDLDKNEAPSGWRWIVDRIVVFDDGAERVVPDMIQADAAEVSAHLGVAVAQQAVDIANDIVVRDAILAERDALAVQVAELRGIIDLVRNTVA